MPETIAWIAKGIVPFLLGCIALVIPAELRGQTDPVLPWQSSFPEFVSVHNKCVKDPTCVLDQFSKKVVTWDARIQAMDLDRQTARLDMGGETLSDNKGVKPSSFLVLIKPEKEEWWKWRSLTKGQKLRFRSVLPDLNVLGQLVSVFYVGSNEVLSILNLVDTELVGRFPEATTAPLQPDFRAEPADIAELLVSSVKIASGGSSIGFNPLLALARPGVNSSRLVAARKSIRDAAADIDGRFLGQSEVDIQFALIQWTTDRDNLTIYPARIRKINKQLLLTWAKEILRVSDIYRANYQYNDTHILFSIIFNDRLWRGTEWAVGQPERALGRLSALPKDSVKLWADASNTTGLLYAAPNSLVTIDELWGNNTFQVAAFDLALPLAKPLIISNAKKAQEKSVPLPRSFEEILVATQSTDLYVRTPAIRELVTSNDPRAIAVLAYLVESQKSSVSDDAIRFGCDIGIKDPTFLDALLRQSKRPNTEIIDSVARCLVRTTDRRAVGAVIERIDDFTFTFLKVATWLEKMTGTKLETLKEWKEWWAANKESFK